MPTFIVSKKDFIKYIETQLTDDHAVVFTNEVAGELSHSKKNGIKVPFTFATSAFNDVGIGHIAFGKTIPMGVLITTKDRLTEQSLTTLNKQQ